LENESVLAHSAVDKTATPFPRNCDLVAWGGIMRWGGYTSHDPVLSHSDDALCPGVGALCFNLVQRQLLFMLTISLKNKSESLRK
jgi:hypothetical protein